MVPLVPFHFLNLGGAYPVISYVVRFFPFFLILIFVLIIWTFNDRVFLKNTGNNKFQTLIITLCLFLFLNCLIALNTYQALIRVLYYSFTGEILFLVILANIQKKEQILILLGLLLIVVSCVSIIGLLEECGQLDFLRKKIFTMNNPHFVQFNKASWKVYATIGNPNPLGSFLCMSAPFFYFLVKHGKSQRVRVLATIGGFICIGLLYFTFSRGTWIAVFVGMLILVGIKSRKLIPFIVLLFIFIFLISINQRKIPNPYTEVVSNYSSYHRTRSFEFVFSVWQQYPLLGVGTGNYRLFSKPMGSKNNTPDNMYLLLLVETGILGLALRLGIGGAILIELIRAYRDVSLFPYRFSLCSQGASRLHCDKDCILSFIISLICFWVNMLSWDALYFPVTRVVFWIIAGLGIAFVRQIYVYESKRV
jgi:putative inorganic carbon (hco3(-)) transporter